MHSWSTRRNLLHLSLLLSRSGLLPTRQGDAHQASCTKTKSTVGSSHTLPSRGLRRRPRLAVQLVCCTRPQHLGLLFRNRTRRLRVCMFLVFGCSIRLATSFTANCSSTPVLTEIADPHRQRSVASSILSTKLLAIFFISRPHTRSTHSFAFVAQSHL